MKIIIFLIFLILTSFNLINTSYSKVKAKILKVSETSSNSVYNSEINSTEKVNKATESNQTTEINKELRATAATTSTEKSKAAATLKAITKAAIKGTTKGTIKATKTLETKPLLKSSKKKRQNDDEESSETSESSSSESSSSESSTSESTSESQSESSSEFSSSSSSSSSSFSSSSTVTVSSKFSASTILNSQTSTAVDFSAFRCGIFNRYSTLELAEKIASAIFAGGEQKKPLITQCFASLRSNLESINSNLESFFKLCQNIAGNPQGLWSNQIFASTILPALNRYPLANDHNISCDQAMLPFADKATTPAWAKMESFFKAVFDNCGGSPPPDSSWQNKAKFLKGEHMKRENLPSGYFKRLNNISRSR